MNIPRGAAVNCKQVIFIVEFYTPHSLIVNIGCLQLSGVVVAEFYIRCAKLVQLFWLING